MYRKQMVIIKKQYYLFLAVNNVIFVDHYTEFGYVFISPLSLAKNFAKREKFMLLIPYDYFFL